MPFNSLLLSKDSETVQVLSRVLKDLGISVEHCAEPFNAAKLLMGHRFDAIIVDCDNAQGAAWVLQSARTAAANKTALTIAIVQAQPGAQATSKMGENFVLCKPILANQAESTLKAARNLMKAVVPSPPAATAASLPTAQASSRTLVSAPTPAAQAPSTSTSQPTALRGTEVGPLHDLLSSNAGAAAAVAPAREPAAKAALPSVMAEGIGTSEEIFRRFPVVPATKPFPQVEATRRPAGLKSHMAEPTPASSLVEHRAAEAAAMRHRLPVVAASEPKSSLRMVIVVGCVLLTLAGLGLAWRNLHSAIQQDTQSLPLQAQPGPEGSPIETASADQTAVPVVNVPQEPVPQPKADEQSEKIQPAAATPKSEAANENVAPPVAHVNKSSAPSHQAATPNTDESDAAPPSLGVVSGTSTSNFAGIVSAVPAALPTVAAPTRVTISQGISQGMLIHQVNPVYPAMAKQARIQGEVVVHALINKLGEVDEVNVVSGPSLLVRSALTAVGQWRYRPYLLNGQAVEVETLITIKFRL